MNITMLFVCTDVSAEGTSSGFMEGFTFDQESTSSGTDNIDGGFSIFGSDNMELSKEPTGASGRRSVSATLNYNRVPLDEPLETQAPLALTIN